jgi:hypothetical protein
MRMLYRKQLEFAVGHHTSVYVEVSKASPDRATRIGTRTIPMRKGLRKLEAGTIGLEVPQNRSWYPFQLAFMLIPTMWSWRRT